MIYSLQKKKQPLTVTGNAVHWKNIFINISKTVYLPFAFFWIICGHSANVTYMTMNHTVTKGTK